MIAYDVNDARRQQLFPVERARWLLPAAGPPRIPHTYQSKPALVPGGTNPE